MNTTVIALREDGLRVAVGKDGARPSVQALYSAPAGDGTVASWKGVIEKLWREHDLPRRGLTLVLPDTAATVRTVQSPHMSQKQLANLVRHEMQNREEQTVVADYMPLGEDAEGKLTMFCAACRAATLEEYLDLFDELDLRLAHVTVPMANYLKAMQRMDEMRGQSCIWMLFEESSVLAVLIEDGQYQYSSRSRIFSEPGTVDFSTEVTRNLSGMLQFHSASRRERSLAAVYYAGCTDDDFEVCIPGIEGLGLKTARLPECGCFAGAPAGEKLSDWLDCVGAMIR